MSTNKSRASRPVTPRFWPQADLVKSLVDIVESFGTPLRRRYENDVLPNARALIIARPSDTQRFEDILDDRLEWIGQALKLVKTDDQAKQYEHESQFKLAAEELDRLICYCRLRHIEARATGKPLTDKKSVDRILKKARELGWPVEKHLEALPKTLSAEDRSRLDRFHKSFSWDRDGWEEIADGFYCAAQRSDELRLPETGCDYETIERKMRDPYPGIDGASVQSATIEAVQSGCVKAERAEDGSEVSFSAVAAWFRKSPFDREKLLFFLAQLAGPELLRRSDPPVLSPVAAKVYDILLQLEPHEAMTGPQIIKALKAASTHIEQSTLTSRTIPELKPYGIENAPRKGYRIPASKRPPAK